MGRVLNRKKITDSGIFFHAASNLVFPGSMMRAQKALHFLALILMVASLVVVALDHVVLPQLSHNPTNCPICRLGHILVSSALPGCVYPIKITALSWFPQEPVLLFCDKPLHAPFSARAPPSLS
jgi:hypothetical protein